VLSAAFLCVLARVRDLAGAAERRNKTSTDEGIVDRHRVQRVDAGGMPIVRVPISARCVDVVLDHQVREV
jgi:hypothetical protein